VEKFSLCGTKASQNRRFMGGKLHPGTSGWGEDPRGCWGGNLLRDAFRQVRVVRGVCVSGVQGNIWERRTPPKKRKAFHCIWCPKTHIVRKKSRSMRRVDHDRAGVVGVDLENRVFETRPESYRNAQDPQKLRQDRVRQRGGRVPRPRWT